LAEQEVRLELRLRPVLDHRLDGLLLMAFEDVGPSTRGHAHEARQGRVVLLDARLGRKDAEARELQAVLGESNAARRTRLRRERQEERQRREGAVETAGQIVADLRRAIEIGETHLIALQAAAGEEEVDER